MSDLPVFSQKSLSSPGMKVGGSRSDAQVSLRVYGGNALLSPGAEYKSILARQDTTTTEVIQQVLERYGEPSDPAEFELCSVLIDEKTGKVKRQRSLTKLLRNREEAAITLEDDMCPVLFADWYGAEKRRFELQRKPPSERKETVRRQGSFFRSFRRRTRTSMPAFDARREMMPSIRRGHSSAELGAGSHTSTLSSSSAMPRIDASYVAIPEEDASSTVAEVGDARSSSSRTESITSSTHNGPAPSGVSWRLSMARRSPRRFPHSRYESTV